MAELQQNGRRLPGYLGLMIICCILGFGLTLQIKSVSKIKTDTVGSNQARTEQLQQNLTEQKNQNAELNRQVQDLKKTVDDYRAQAGKSGDVNRALNDQLNRAEILAGMEDVQGKGVVVTMDDSTAAIKAGQDQSAYVIHDTDVLQVLNELRDAGAEALSLNDERILATTEVRCAGNVVSVNNTRYSTPFVIRAVGNPDKLKSAILMRNGIADVLGQWGITVSVSTSDSVLIKAYSGTPKMDYAKPAKGGS